MPTCTVCGDRSVVRLEGESYCSKHAAEWDGNASYEAHPVIKSDLTCGHCGEEWDWTFRADQEEYEIECPGCGATWTTEGQQMSDDNERDAQHVDDLLEPEDREQLVAGDGGPADGSLFSRIWDRLARITGGKQDSEGK